MREGRGGGCGCGYESEHDKERERDVSEAPLAIGEEWDSKVTGKIK